MERKNGLKHNLTYTLVLLLFSIFFLSSKVFAKFAKQDFAAPRAYKFEKYYDNEKRDFQNYSRRGRGPQKYALIIGQNNYSTQPLKTCVNDAKAMAKVFAKNLYIPKKNIRLLLDKEVDKNTILKALDSLSKTTRPGDKVFFYYSGHSIRTYDNISGEKSTSLLFVTGEKLSARRFTKSINKINATKILFFDSCYAGGMITKQYNKANYKTGSSFSKAYVIASSRYNQVSMTIPLYKHSRFTYFLREAILNNRADKNNDGKLSLKEVFSWTKKYTLLFGEKYGALHNPIIFGNNPSTIILNEKQNKTEPNAI